MRNRQNALTDMPWKRKLLSLKTGNVVLNTKSSVLKQKKRENQCDISSVYIPNFTNYPLSSSDKLSNCASHAFRMRTSSHNSLHAHDLDQLVSCVWKLSIYFSLDAMNEWNFKVSWNDFMNIEERYIALINQLFWKFLSQSYVELPR